jgi:hypothetical protein
VDGRQSRITRITQHSSQIHNEPKCRGGRGGTNPHSKKTHQSKLELELSSTGRKPICFRADSSAPPDREEERPERREERRGEDPEEEERGNGGAAGVGSEQRQSGAAIARRGQGHVCRMRPAGLRH